jgi:hypothetical protein
MLRSPRLTVALAAILFPAVAVAQSSQTCAEITIVTWIDGNAITLPKGEGIVVEGLFPPLGPWPFLSSGWAACDAELVLLANGNIGVIPNDPADVDYANAWLLKYSGNSNPGASITPSTFTSLNYQYRLFADYSPGLNIHTTSIGYTPDPCGTPFAYVQGDAYSQNGNYTGDPLGTGPSQQGYQFLLAETRVGAAGQAGWKALNNQHEIPWVWSVIEFDQNGNPIRLTAGANYQIFPTYSIYKNGMFVSKMPLPAQSTAKAFAGLPPGQSLQEQNIF